MKRSTKIHEILDRRVLILDGATGTELHKRGMPAGVCPEKWCLEHPQVLRAVHADYAAAGSDIVFTCTFGANAFKLDEYGLRRDVRRINRELAGLAKESAGGRTLIAGDIGPTGKFVAPFGALEFEHAIEAFKEQARGLLEGGVDLFVIETMIDIQEARAALIAVKEVTDRFVMVTMTYEKDGRTLNGTDPVTALITLQSLGADAVGCNCSTGPEEMLRLIVAMQPYSKVPLVAKPNAGLPRLVDEKTVFDMSAREFADFGRKFTAAGVGLIGGCCGTNPRHIEALKVEIGDEKPVRPLRNSICALSSARRSVILEERDPLIIIGERINPTGKKLLQEALEKDLHEGRLSLIRNMAKEQEKEGAKLLDVNVGVHGIDEAGTMAKVVGFLSTVTDLPLVIDSPNPEAIEAALRFYPGRALINSISAESGKTEKLLPVAAKYGAMFILLPVTEREVPRTANARKEVIKRVYRQARRYGFTKDDLVVDGLVMAVASHGDAPLETLDTIEWCSSRFKARTVLGISNVSFGMPERKWMNSAFLAMAAAKGLNMAIANPSHEELMNIKASVDVLSGRDRNSAAYIARFSGAGAQAHKQDEAPAAITPMEKVARAILEGNREEITDFLQVAMASGVSAFELVDAVMIPMITRVGELFEKRTYFLPQLIASAEAMKRGVDFLEPCLTQDDLPKTRETVLLATVEGDIHDIGKNIVSLILKNHGYDVIDLGKDVPAEKIVEQAKLRNPAVIGLSALMTTTMARMKEVVELGRKEGLTCLFIVGGAVVTKSFARSIGAQYAKDGVEAVQILSTLGKNKRESL
ncbi:MAG: homocysteine S-methyltransferase family protein [Syntrophales bacterium]